MQRIAGEEFATAPVDRLRIKTSESGGVTVPALAMFERCESGEQSTRALVEQVNEQLLEERLHVGGLCIFMRKNGLPGADLALAAIGPGSEVKEAAGELLAGKAHEMSQGVAGGVLQDSIKLSGETARESVRDERLDGDARGTVCEEVNVAAGP